MILACHNISHSFGSDVVLKDISFHIEDQEKTAIVGINGAGKSTLLKIIIGELSPDSGSVITSKGKTIGYLSQHQDISGDRSIFDELMEEKKEVNDLYAKMKQLEIKMKDKNEPELSSLLKTYTQLTHQFESLNGYACHSEVSGILKGLGFSEEDKDKLLHTLSGGQKTRVALGRLLLSRPDIMLLDEPTNHLDIDSITWLETFLSGYPGAVLIVSHDRFFINRIVTKIIEIDHHLGHVYLGDYSAYSDKKSLIRQAQIKAYTNQQKIIKHQEGVIRKLKSFNREKSIKRAESREKLLNKMDTLDKPTTDAPPMNIQLTPRHISGKDVLHIENLCHGFDGLTLFDQVNIDIRRGEKVALIGNNGTGKTTILKLVNGLFPAISGDIKPGANVHTGYYDQEHQLLHPDNTIFSEIADAYPTLNHTKIRNTLAAFLFTGDDVFKQIKDLSGGEQGRVSLAKLMLSDANFLILDEPTNHLDIISKEILENAISGYTGTILYVSHDRYFVNATATRILELDNGQVISYLGNYDDYLMKKEHADIAIAVSPTAPDAFVSSGKSDYLRRKEAQAKERKRQSDTIKTQKRIEEIEDHINRLDSLLGKEEVYTNPDKLLEISNEKEMLDDEYLELLERLEELES